MALEWFPSFDAIPGVDWSPLVEIDRSKLRGVDARPYAVHNWTEWRLPDGRGLSSSIGSSPCDVHAEKLGHGERELAPRTIAKVVSEALALPGTRSDYHFTLLPAANALNQSRLQDVRAFGWIETICLADVSLMEQGPELVFAEEHWQSSDLGSVAGPLFDRLIKLYLAEGFIAEAADLARRLQRLGGGGSAGEKLIAKHQALMEEDGR